MQAVARRDDLHLEKTQRRRFRPGPGRLNDPSLGAYMALGRGGQMIFVVPGLDLIVVTTAEGVAHEELFRLVEEGIVPAVK